MCGVFVQALFLGKALGSANARATVTEDGNIAPLVLVASELNPLVAADDLLRRGQHLPHDETGYVQPFVGGRGREQALLVLGGAEFETAVTGCGGAGH